MNFKVLARQMTHYDAVMISHHCNEASDRRSSLGQGQICLDRKDQKDIKWMKKGVHV